MRRAALKLGPSASERPLGKPPAAATVAIVRPIVAMTARISLWSRFTIIPSCFSFDERWRKTHGKPQAARHAERRTLLCGGSLGCGVLRTKQARRLDSVMTGSFARK